MATTNATILGIAHHLPEATLTNERLAREFGAWDEEKIVAKTGIVSRRIAGPDEFASDLGVEAAKKLFSSVACAPGDIDFLIYCTQSPDHFLPATACSIQHRLGLATNCGAIDINQGCSGYVYGLGVAKGLVDSGLARRVLFVTAETYSKFINPNDRSTRTIFGDGASATLIGASDSPEESIGPFVFGTDGSGGCNLIVPAGGLRLRASAETAVESGDEGNRRSQDNIYMNGPEIFTFTLQAVPRAIRRLLAASGLAMEEIDRFVFHQANAFMLERLRAKMEIPPEKFVVELEQTGNTVSSSIPIALQAAADRGDLRPGDRLMLVGFGVGYSWAAAIVRWPNLEGSPRS